jgi:hypothetical protein
MVAIISYDWKLCKGQLFFKCYIILSEIAVDIGISLMCNRETTGENQILGPDDTIIENEIKGNRPESYIIILAPSGT